ncbi:AAA family ATPase [Primorskyibacter sp. 2E107]|uniref:AAA family ATPase n=1 Tax=Primorskyibacter sp. 2E107 TaxID=3403458 RepID=UPI003AF5F968
MRPWIVTFSGLPGVGKSTVSRMLAEGTGALWLRIDDIEAAMRNSHMQVNDLADGGYAAAQAVAGAALEQGFCVVADCVNPIELTRRGWREPARRTGAGHLDVEVICSNPDLHRRRVEMRRDAPKGVQLPDWKDVLARDYEPFEGALRVDTARLSAAEAVTRIRAEMEGRGWLS